MSVGTPYRTTNTIIMWHLLPNASAIQWLFH